MCHYIITELAKTAMDFMMWPHRSYNF